jgi:hypothetical protein
MQIESASFRRKVPGQGGNFESESERFLGAHTKSIAPGGFGATSEQNSILCMGRWRYPTGVETGAPLLMAPTF